MSELIARFEVVFPSFHLQVKASIPAEGITVVFGPSGCGKTTFLRCLAGLERSPDGFLSLGEQVWQDEPNNIFLPLSQRPVGFVFQDPRLFPHLSVRSNLLYGWKRIPESERRISLDQVVEILGLGSLLERRPTHLSGGEQQRVAIGRALLTSPRLLLMDEPLSSLDVQRKREIMTFIQRLDKEFRIPILYVSHALHEVVQLAKTLILLKDGSVAAIGPLAEVFSQVSSRRVIPDSHIGAVIDTRVAEHDFEFGLTTLTFSGGQLSVPHQHYSIGESLRVQILARDVSLVANPPVFQTSVLNVLMATVMEIGPIEPGQPFVDIKLDIGCPLLATITRKSLVTLKLHPGQKVHAQIKAVALTHDYVE
ncbi:molybdenum ABC transporter ATP-binding protein [uncultured Nitrospira sp.]|uniref:molybdenum ABC transporter ATP-binding protein n=1 Tax=uncultured Nitrospira sp. TaxID=157176 RepID=UPI0031406D4D